MGNLNLPTQDQSKSIALHPDPHKSNHFVHLNTFIKEHTKSYKIAMTIVCENFIELLGTMLRNHIL